MRALQLVASRRVELVEVPAPSRLAEDDILLRIQAVGICGTDLHYYRGETTGNADFPLPFIMGHEFAGVVEATGARVSALAPGDRVVVDPAVSCGVCEFCLGGHPHVCPRCRFVGSPGVAGALQELLVHPARLAFKLGARITSAQAATLEPLGVALHAADLAGLRIADRVAVLGCGPIGLFLVQLARLAGARDVYATDRLAYRLELAKRCGATIVLDVAREDPVGGILDVTGGRGVDVAFEVAGATETPDQAAAVTRPLGTVVIVGICADDRMSFTAAPSRRKGLTIKISRRMKHVYERVLALMDRQMIAVDGLISHVVPPEEGPAAFEMLASYRDGAVKVVVAMG
jgi:L-iditol 2-dehydrogenase